MTGETLFWYSVPPGFWVFFMLIFVKFVCYAAEDGSPVCSSECAHNKYFTGAEIWFKFGVIVEVVPPAFGFFWRFIHITNENINKNEIN